MKNKGNHASRGFALGAALFFTLSATPAAFAEETGWYIGGSVGQSKADVDVGAINAAFLAGGFTAASTTVDDTDTAYKLFVGYQFGKNWAIEGGYVDLGKATADTTTTPAATYRITDKAAGWFLDAVGILPVGTNSGIFAKVGAFNWDVDYRCEKLSGTGSCTNPERSASGTDLKYGVGFKYDFAKQVGLRAEWERFEDVGSTGSTGTGQASVDLLSIGIQYKF